jgi:hypothetical protein
MTNNEETGKRLPATRNGRSLLPHNYMMTSGEEFGSTPYDRVGPPSTPEPALTHEAQPASITPEAVAMETTVVFAPEELERTA